MKSERLVAMPHWVSITFTILILYAVLILLSNFKSLQCLSSILIKETTLQGLISSNNFQSE